MRKQGIAWISRLEKGAAPEVAPAAAGVEIRIQAIEQPRSRFRLGLPQAEQPQRRFLEEVLLQPSRSN